MIRNVKKYLLHSICMLALLGGMTACDGFTIDWGNSDIGGNGNGNENGNENGNGNGNENGEDEKSHELVNCWHLVKYCGAEADAEIYVDFGKEGKFAIYQRTESLEFVVFNGTYTIDEENSVVSGVYDDGASWLCDYKYIVDEKAKTLTLTNAGNALEVSVYEESEVPASAVVNTRSASVSDVKPL